MIWTVKLRQAMHHCIIIAPKYCNTFRFACFDGLARALGCYEVTKLDTRQRYLTIWLFDAPSKRKYASTQVVQKRGGSKQTPLSQASLCSGSWDIWLISSTTTTWPLTHNIYCLISISSCSLHHEDVLASGQAITSRDCSAARSQNDRSQNNHAGNAAIDCLFNARLPDPYPPHRLASASCCQSYRHPRPRATKSQIVYLPTQAFSERHILV